MDAIAVFVKVVEAGSFSAAARRLSIPKAKDYIFTTYPKR